jgi:hypothetical protein
MTKKTGKEGKRTKDFFSIDIVLHHPSCGPESISEALSIKPQGAHAMGQRLGKLRAKRTFFYACLQKSEYVSELEGALAKAVRFLEKHAAFWTDFIGGRGEVELILNHTIYPKEEEGDKSFELYLAPDFLRHLSTRGIGLRVQGWQAGVKTKVALPPRRVSPG